MLSVLPGSAAGPGTRCSLDRAAVLEFCDFQRQAFSDRIRRFANPAREPSYSFITKFRGRHVEATVRFGIGRRLGEKTVGSVRFQHEPDDSS